MVEHNLIRATLIPEIVKMIAEHFGIDESEALNRFWRSGVGANFADDETGLYGQSPLYIYGLFLEEQSESDRKEEKE